MQQKPLDYDLLLVIGVIKALGSVRIMHFEGVKFEDMQPVRAAFCVEEPEIACLILVHLCYSVVISLCSPLSPANRFVVFTSVIR